MISYKEKRNKSDILKEVVVLLDGIKVGTIHKVEEFHWVYYPYGFKGTLKEIKNRLEGEK